MISRRTATAIGTAYKDMFTGPLKFTTPRRDGVYRDKLYEFLFNCDFPAWFCNQAKWITNPKEVKEFFMKLHTGETQARVTANWSWSQREKLGQQYLRESAEALLKN